MQLPCNRTHDLPQASFDVSVDVLEGVIDNNVAAGDFFRYLAQSGHDRSGLVRGDNCLPRQHPAMRDAAKDVRIKEAPIELDRLGELLKKLIRRRVESTTPEPLAGQSEGFA